MNEYSSSSPSLPPPYLSGQNVAPADQKLPRVYPTNPSANETTPLVNGQHSRAADDPESKSPSWTIITVVSILLLIPIGGFMIRGRAVSSSPQAPGPTWINITPSQVCSSIGARTYTATSSDTPQGFHPDAHCSERLLEIHGRNVRPLSCYSEAIEEEFVDGNTTRTFVYTLTTGKWLIDFGETDCFPTWDDSLIPDKLCAEYGTRWYTAQMSFSQIPDGLDHLESCRNTSGHNAHGQSALPQDCKADNARGMIRARFKFDDDPTCSTARWENVRPDYQCKEYGKKRYTGVLRDVPEGLDGLDVCKKIRYPFFDLPGKALAPEECEVENVWGKVRVLGTWTIDFHVPECLPVVRDLEDKGCIRTHYKRVEGWLDGLGKDEDQSHMCMTTPIFWDGDKYLPKMCEARASWYTYQWASYHVWDPRCH